MAQEPIPAGGLSSRVADEQIPFESAFDATNVIIDNDAWVGRNGYRLMQAGGAIGSGTTQLATRFRPAYNDARLIVARNNALYSVTDPSTETAADGVVAAGLTPSGWGAGSFQMSAAQLGKYLYIGSDQSGKTWARMKPDYTLETITALDKPDKPAYTLSSLTFTKFTTLDTPTGSFDVQVTDWHRATDGAGGVAAVGSTLVYIFGSTSGGGTPAGVDQNWSNANWLFLAIAPPTADSVRKVTVELGDAAGNYSVIGEISDGPGDDAPFAAYLSLRSVPSSIRSAVRKIRFTLTSNTGYYAVHGFMPVYSAPQPGDVSYFVTAYQSSTQNESPQSDVRIASFSDAGISIPTFHAASFNHSTIYSIGTISADPAALKDNWFFNKGAGLSFPARSEFSGIPTFTGSMDAVNQANADTIRLWRITPNGARLAKTTAMTASYSMKDDTGDAVLGNQSYVAGGAPPPCIAMSAVGQRLIAGGDPSNPNRLSISNFLPFGQTSDPFPVFPALALSDADGWSFDISPAPTETVLQLTAGDKVLYISTNEATYWMPDLSPNAPPYETLRRGVLGRQAGCWAEDAYHIAAHDGVYQIRRGEWSELSLDYRRGYTSWLAPDSTTVVRYQDRKLYITCGTRQLRYDFANPNPDARWTRHTLAHTFLFGASWRDPTANLMQLWYFAGNGNIYRWQASATSDAGTAIADWTYSTGFAIFQKKRHPRFLYVDTNGSVVVSGYRLATGSAIWSKTYTAEAEKPLAADPTGYKWRIGMTAANNVTVRRMMWDFEEVDAKGVSGP